MTATSTADGDSLLHQPVYKMEPWKFCFMHLACFLRVIIARTEAFVSCTQSPDRDRPVKLLQQEVPLTNNCFQAHSSFFPFYNE